MEHVACDLCGGADARRVYRVPDTNYGTAGQFDIVQCRGCQLVYLNPRPKPSRYLEIYPQAAYDPFDAHAQTQPPSTPRERARRLTRRLGAGRALDVGCGTGLFLLALRAEGWDCVGVEPSPRASEFARTYLRLDVRSGTIFDVDALESFDLITFWDALEHLPSPRAALLRAHKLLTPRGFLALSLPNWDSIERRVFGAQWIALDAPRHFYHFAPATLRRLLSLCGFEIQSLEARATVLSLASNVLRWSGCWILRRGTPKPASALNDSTRRQLSPQRRAVIRLTHLAMTPLNALFNSIQCGADLVALARKA